MLTAKMTMLALAIISIMNIFLIQLSSGCDVRTQSGDCCIFPFKYKNKIYHSCTTKDYLVSWCSTTSNFPSDKKWSECKFSICQVKTTDGECCTFPFTSFIYKYTGCTTAGNKAPWCRTTSGKTGTCRPYVEPCFSNPCKNGGTCESNEAEFSCKCTGAYKGTTCEKKVYPCDSSPCKNGATCANEDDEKFRCNCTKGFEGVTCEKKVYPCDSSPCQNNATCENREDTFFCNCTKGYEGTACEEKVDPCDSSPCKNNATCQSKNDQFNCTCSYGFKGPTCEEEVDPCESSPCKNEAICEKESVENFTCICTRGYEGPVCENEVNPCDSSPCLHGGTCQRKKHEFTCECTEPTYSGPTCANHGTWKSVPMFTPPFHIAADGYRDMGARFVDLNGDGRKDLVFHRWIDSKTTQKGAYLNVPDKGFVDAPEFTPPFHISADNHHDVGARFVDLNGDGKIDFVYHRWLNKDKQQKGAYLNTGKGWKWAPQFTPPYHIAADGSGDLGTRFIELNGDGKIDYVYHRWMNKRHRQKGAYLNTGNGWKWAPAFIPPHHIAADRHGDLGVRFVDLNGDGRHDMVYHRWINLFHQQKGAFLNDGHKWVWAPQFTPPYHIAVDGRGDLGVRFVDLNGDGNIDMVYHRWRNHIWQEKGAYINSGKGWKFARHYTPPYHIAADNHGDLGGRFADVTGDGLIDFVYHRWMNSKKQQKGAYVNTGGGWKYAPEYTPPFHIAADGHRDLGVRFVDLNGDGAVDMAYHRWVKKDLIQKGAYLACGDTLPAYCRCFGRFCSTWSEPKTICRATCNTCRH